MGSSVLKLPIEELTRDEIINKMEEACSSFRAIKQQFYNLPDSAPETRLALYADAMTQARAFGLYYGKYEDNGNSVYFKMNGNLVNDLARMKEGLKAQNIKK